MIRRVPGRVINPQKRSPAVYPLIVKAFLDLDIPLEGLDRFSLQLDGGQGLSPVRRGTCQEGQECRQCCKATSADSHPEPP